MTTIHGIHSDIQKSAPVAPLGTVRSVTWKAHDQVPGRTGSVGGVRLTGRLPHRHENRSDMAQPCRRTSWRPEPNHTCRRNSLARVDLCRGQLVPAVLTHTPSRRRRP